MKRRGTDDVFCSRAWGPVEQHVQAYEAYLRQARRQR